MNNVSNDINKSSGSYNAFYFKGLCCIPWVYLFMYIGSFFATSLWYYLIAFLIGISLIILNIVFVAKDISELKNVNIYVKQNLITYSILVLLFGPIVIELYFIARKKTGTKESGRINVWIPIICFVVIMIFSHMRLA